MLCMEFYNSNLAANSKVCSQSGSWQVPFVFPPVSCRWRYSCSTLQGSPGAIGDLLREASAISWISYGKNGRRIILSGDKLQPWSPCCLFYSGLLLNGELEFPAQNLKSVRPISHPLKSESWWRNAGMKTLNSNVACACSVDGSN